MHRQTSPLREYEHQKKRVVVNLSKGKLNENEELVLSLGMNFAITLKEIPTDEVIACAYVLILHHSTAFKLLPNLSGSVADCIILNIFPGIKQADPCRILLLTAIEHLLEHSSSKMPFIASHQILSPPKIVSLPPAMLL